MVFSFSFYAVDDIVINDDSPLLPRLPGIEPSSFVSQESRSTAFSNYLPQINDKVVYFPRGHAEFLESSRLAHSTSCSIISVDEEYFIARVARVEWTPDFLLEYNDAALASSSASSGDITRRLACPRARLELVVLDQRHNEESSCNSGYSEDLETRDVEIWYESGLSPFIILYSLFRQGLANRPAVGDSVLKIPMLASNTDMEDASPGRVVEREEYNSEPLDSIWKSVAVQRGEDGNSRICLYSPWQVQKENEIVMFPSHESSLDDQGNSQITFLVETERISGIISECTESEEYEVFTEQVCSI